MSAAHAAVASAASAASDLEVRLARLSADQDDAWAAVEKAGEDYTEATVELEAAAANAESTDRLFARAQADRETARQVVVGIALQSMRSGGSVDELQAFLSADGVSEIVEQTEALSRLGERTERAVQQYRAAAIVADTLGVRAKAALAKREAAAGSAALALDAAKETQKATEVSVASAKVEREALIATLAQTRRTSVAVERARQDRLDKERKQRDELEAKKNHTGHGTDKPTAGKPTVDPPKTDPPKTDPPKTDPPKTDPPKTDPPKTDPPKKDPKPTPTPAPEDPAPGTDDPYGLGTGTSRGSAAKGRSALAWAKKQVDLPYAYGASGPDSYDCSGLTMRAWEHAGLALNRTSRDQYRQTLKIAYDDLRVGDLVFWGSDSSDPGSVTHVAMWAGNGQIIEAPRPGKAVRVVPMRWTGTMDFAGRP